LARDSGYLLLAFPFGLVAFTVVSIGLALGTALVMLWVGLPLLAATLAAAHGLAELDLLRLAAAGRDLRGQRRALPPPARHGGPQWLIWARWMLAPLRDPMRWREAVYCLLALVIGTVTWSITMILWVTAVAGLTSALWEPFAGALGPGPEGQNLAELLGWNAPDQLVDTVLGLAAVALLPGVSRGLTALHALVARALLVPGRMMLAKRVAELERSRERASAAEAQSLRRLERDIHDGPQQRLVRLSMDLAAAQRRLEGGDVGAAQDLLADARGMTDQAIAELRGLSRGIAPPILMDRGLAAALSAVAAGQSTPVRLIIEPPNAPRLPEAQETALYFAASELLANVAKHSGAASVDVVLAVPSGAEFATLTVSDSGRGGAVFIPGHGLAGLRDRLAGVDGTIELAGDLGGAGGSGGAGGWGGPGGGGGPGGASGPHGPGKTDGPGGTNGTVVTVKVPLRGTGVGSPAGSRDRLSGGGALPANSVHAGADLVGSAARFAEPAPIGREEQGADSSGGRLGPVEGGPGPAAA
jgi:signal transduction histidine kinase